MVTDSNLKKKFTNRHWSYKHVGSANSRPFQFGEQFIYYVFEIKLNFTFNAPDCINCSPIFKIPYKH